MRFSPPYKNRARRLPGPVQDYIRHRFNLVPGYLKMLRCFEYDGQVNEKRVRRLGIFSPDRVREYHLSITTNQDLGQHPEMLLFEGYIDSQGTVYVADRRAPLRTVRR